MTRHSPPLPGNHVRWQVENRGKQHLMASGTKRKAAPLPLMEGDLENETEKESEQKKCKSTGKRMSSRHNGTRVRLDKDQLPVRKIVDDIIQEEEAEEAEEALVEVSDAKIEIKGQPADKMDRELTMGTMKALLGEQLKNLATRKDIDSIGERITANADEIAKLRGLVNRIEQDTERANAVNRETIINDVQRIVGDRITSLNSVPHGSEMNLTYAPKEESFLRARRSLRIWPIEGTDERTMRIKLEDFLIEALRMDHREIEKTLE